MLLISPKGIFVTFSARIVNQIALEGSAHSRGSFQDSIGPRTLHGMYRHNVCPRSQANRMNHIRNRYSAGVVVHFGQIRYRRGHALIEL